MLIQCLRGQARISVDRADIKTEEMSAEFARQGQEEAQHEAMPKIYG
jgi:hypothetical protein